MCWVMVAMAKRLSKRQQRELEEAQLLEAQEKELAPEEPEHEEVEEGEAGPVNAFAIVSFWSAFDAATNIAQLNAGAEEEDEEETDIGEPEDAGPKKVCSIPWRRVRPDEVGQEKEEEEEEARDCACCRGWRGRRECDY